MDDDGDIRYRADIQGYSRDVRKRVRTTEHQVALLVTARIRDTSTAAIELAPATISERVRELVTVTRLTRELQANRTDLRAAYASLAATAIICAEAADRPRALGGTAPTPGALSKRKTTNVVPIRKAKVAAVPVARPQRIRKTQPMPGQISLWGDAA